MNLAIGTCAAKFLFWEYVFQIFSIGSLQCTPHYNSQHNTHNTQYKYTEYLIPKANKAALYVY